MNRDCGSGMVCRSLQCVPESTPTPTSSSGSCDTTACVCSKPSCNTSNCLC